MRKYLGIILLLAMAFMLFGCTSYNGKDYIEKVEVSEKITGDEKTELIEKITKKFNDFSKITYKATYMEKDSLTDDSGSADYTIVAYKNNLIKIDMNGVDTSKVGIVITEKNNSEFVIWDNADEKAIMCRVTANSEDPLFYTVFGYNGVEEEVEEKKASNAYGYVLNMILPFALNNVDIYKTKDGGYIAISTDKKEKYSAVNWGSDTKELYTLTEEQEIVVISKDFEIKKITSYSQSKTNRDPQSGEWYSKSRTVSEDTLEINVSYGSKKDNSKLVTELNQSYVDYKNKKANEKEDE